MTRSPRRIDADPLDHIVARPPAVADDDAGGAKRRAFRRQIAAMRQRHLGAAREGAGAREWMRGVQVVHPVGAGNPAVAAVDDRLRARRAQAPPHALPGPRQQRAAEQMPVERPPDAVHRDGRQRGEIGPGAMRDEMDLVARRQIARQRVVRRVHAAERREIARDDQPRHRLMRGRSAIAPRSMPSRNQNCMPTAVPNGTK